MTDCSFTDESVFCFKIFTTFFGLYQLAEECCQLQKPACQLQRPTLRTNQDHTFICFNDEIHPYPPTRRISLDYFNITSKDTGPSAGLSLHQIRTFSSSRINIPSTVRDISINPGISGGALAIVFNHRPSFSQ